MTSPSTFDPLAPTFAPGDVVAARYRIARPLGQGAMGEVYAAVDLELGGEVALKTLRAGAVGGGRGVERFKREILLARRITHPNVCRLFDLGVHRIEGAGEERAVLFLTMELLAGRTLVAELEQEGPLAESAAVAIARQLAEALAAAHRAGVVHRDFKSGNILLVPAPNGELRAVVTDFGLARAAGSDGNDGATLTEAGGLLGTPAYMAPEQVEGKAADARSDIFSFGVVLYEMVTGELPFEGESPMSTALKRLREPPRPIEDFRTDLSPRFRATLKRCLARDPGDRFAEPLEVARALTGEAPVGHSWWRRAPAAAAVALLVAAAGAGAWWASRSGGASARAERRAVAVLGLRNATGSPESAWLSTALAEMLATELGADGAVRTLPGASVAQALADLGLDVEAGAAADSGARLRARLGADTLVSGAFVALGAPGRGPLRLDLRLRGPAGEDRPLSIEGDESELFALVARAGGELRRALALPSRADGADVAALRATQPGNETAMRLYAEGLDRLRAAEALEARERFERALEADRDFALAWAGLAAAWSELGYDERARAAAEEAWKRSAGLPRADAMLVEGIYRRFAREWERAIDLFRALYRFYPDDPEQGLRLAEVELEAARATDAAATLEELRRLPPPAGEDPRIDLQAASAAEALSDFRAQLGYADAAAAKAARVGARRLEARALRQRGIALRKLGRLADSRAALAVAARRAREAGDVSTEAGVWFALANLERGEGDLAAADALFARARAAYSSLGHRSGEARVELSQASVASERGDLAGAQRLGETALAKLREIGDRRGAAVALSNLGTLLYERGDLAAALARHEEAIAEFRALDDPARVVISLLNLAPIRLARGDLAGAGAALDEALASSRSRGDRRGEGYTLQGLGTLAYERGENGAARSRLTEARELFRAAGLEPAARETEALLAAVTLEEGRPAEAASELARLAAEARRAGEVGDAALAEVDRVRALLAAGRTVEARQLSMAALAAADQAPASQLRHRARLARAELALAAERRDEARAQLDAARAEAETSGDRLRELEIDLAAAALEGDATVRARAAAAVAMRAHGFGCGRLELRAAALGARAPSVERSTPPS